MSRAAVFFVLSSVVFASACAPPEEPTSPAAEAASPKKRDDDLPPMLPPLKKEDEVVGTGPEAKKGDRVAVHYTGTLLDGTKFDSSLDRGTPFEFVIGEGSVIAGWELGVVGMKKGGKRKLVVPPHLGYGTQGRPPTIGPDTTLLFEIQLVDIVEPAPVPAPPLVDPAAP